MDLIQASRSLLGRRRDEEDVPTQSETPEPHARIPDPDEDEGRARGSFAASAEGPAPSDSVTTLDQRLSASERLRRKADFEELYRSGRRLATRWFIAYVRLRDTGRMRLGVVASRRVGGAVARNRAKRLFREVFRKRKGVRLPADVVLVARPEVVNASYREVEEAYESTVYASLERGARTRR